MHANKDYALQLALGSDKYEAVKLLLQNGVNVHAGVDYALRCAAFNGNTEMVRLLLDHGADIHAENHCVLHDASRFGGIVVGTGAPVHVNEDVI